MALNQQTQQLYEFGPFRIDRLERVMLRDGEVVALTPKVFDILLILVENTGHIVEKEKLMNEVWPDSFVEEGNLTQNVSTLRKALADGADGHAYIQTIARRGYRFVGNVREAVEGRRSAVEECSNSHLVVEQEKETSVAVTCSAEAEQAILEKGITVRVGGKRGSRMRLSTGASVTWVVVACLSVALSVWIWKKPRPIESGAKVRTIAVLPFKPLVADARNESLELGMAETLINKLSSIREIIVRPISAVRRYTDLNQDPLAAGRELEVDAVLDASIQWEGENTIRVAARLLRVADGSTIWTDKCDKQCSNILELQDSIAERVAGALSLRLTDEEIKQLSKRYTENTAAYQLYLNGFFYSLKDGSENGRKALGYYNQALALDPNFALAYAAESNIYRAFWRDNVLDPKEARSRGRAAAVKALELDETLAEAHSALAYINRYEWDWSGAESEFKRAIELNPNLSSARNAHSFQLSAMGRHGEALAENKRAQELEPSRLAFRYDEGSLLLLARKYDDSIQHAQNMIGIEPDSVGAETNLGRAYAAKGMYTEAIAALHKAVSLAGERTDLDPSRTDLQCFLGNAFALSGKRDEALAILHKLKAMKEYVSHALIATIYAGLGEKEEAFHSLEKAYAAHDLELRYVGTDPAYDNLRTDPRFTDLLRRVGLLP